MNQNNLQQKIQGLKNKNLVRDFQVNFQDVNKYLNKSIKDFKIAKKNIKKELIQNFDELRKKRNKFIYDICETEISNSELRHYFEEAKEFIILIRKVIQNKNPQKELF